jgi:hypothetical protein
VTLLTDPGAPGHDRPSEKRKVGSSTLPLTTTRGDAMLDTVGPEYLQDDDLGAQAPSGERALGLVRGYGTRTTTRR